MDIEGVVIIHGIPESSNLAALFTKKNYDQSTRSDLMMLYHVWLLNERQKNVMFEKSTMLADRTRFSFELTTL